MTCNDKLNQNHIHQDHEKHRGISSYFIELYNDCFMCQIILSQENSTSDQLIEKCEVPNAHSKLNKCFNVKIQN